MVPDIRLIDCKLTDSITGVILGARLTTFQELRKEVSIEEAHALYEIVVVDRINQWRILESKK